MASNNSLTNLEIYTPAPTGCFGIAEASIRIFGKIIPQYKILVFIIKYKSEKICLFVWLLDKEIFA